jgi:hypothetical protein
MRIEMTELREQPWRVWLLALSPTVWAAHFLMCYVTAAVWCAKLPAGTSLQPVRLAIGGYTVAALAGIAIVWWIGFRAWTHGRDPGPYDADTPEDRHRFLGFATVLLSGLSGIAVVYAALVPVFLDTCQ